MRSVLILALLTTLCASCHPGNDNTPVPGGYSGRLYASSFDNGSNALTTAEFFKTPIDLYTSGDSATRVFVSAVVSNGYNMIEHATGPASTPPFTEGFYEGLASNASNAIAWSVLGGNGIPNFNWTDGSPYPVFTGQLPDSISLSAGYAFDFSSGQIQNADTAAIVMDGPLSGSVQKGIRLPGKITFSPSELFGKPGDTVVLNLWFGKYSTQTFSGKNFAFIKTTRTARAVVFH